jgi:hypothetical protein
MAAFSVAVVVASLVVIPEGDLLLALAFAPTHPKAATNAKASANATKPTPKTPQSLLYALLMPCRIASG